MTTQTPIGKSLPRTDGFEKVTGAAKYSADLPAVGVLFGRVLRSPHPHARIKAVDVSRAAAVPGVHAAITGEDVRGHMTGRRVFDIPLIAWDVARFVGDVVAAVAADDEETAERALALIDVTYEPLTPVFDPMEAIKPGAPLLHPDFNSYAGGKPQSEPSNIFVTSTWGTGDPSVGFVEADDIIEGTYTSQLMHQAYMEPHTCLVDCRADGHVHVWASNRGPHSLKADVAKTTGIEPAKLHIHFATIGGDFGGKGGQMNVPIAYFLSKKAGRPVRMLLDYVEELGAANPRHPARVDVRMGVKRDGAITATEVTGYYDSGAYGGFLPLGFLPGPRHCVGAYRIPHSKITVHHIYTNRVPAGHMRGPGEPQTAFAMESHLDVVARKLGIDPAEMRRRNMIREGDKNGLGEEYHDLHGEELFELALERAGYGMSRPAEGSIRRGLGIGIGERAPAGGETHAGITFRQDGTVVLHTTIFEQGSGTHTIQVQMAADVLNIDPERIVIDILDTDANLYDSGAGASRNTRMASEAVYHAAVDAKSNLARLAAELLGWREESIELNNDGVTNGMDTIRLPDLLSRTDVTVSGSHHYKDMAHAHVTAFTVQIAEVAVDTETGQVTVERLTSAHDAGKVLNPVGHTGQINGGAMQGFGYSVMEELLVKDGRVETLSLADYKVPTFADIPELQTIVTESDSGGVGPFNVKAIGENPFSPTGGAVANAVADAVRVRITSLPITAEKVYRALREQGLA